MESLGRSAVPIILRRMRVRRLSLWALLASITAITFLLLSGLANLTPYLLVAVADALALVRLRRSNLPDFRRHLADPLLVYTAYHDRRCVRHLEVYTFSRAHRDRVRVTNL